jgi:hypothetical protein
MGYKAVPRERLGLPDWARGGEVGRQILKGSPTRLPEATSLQRIGKIQPIGALACRPASPPSLSRRQCLLDMPHRLDRAHGNKITTAIGNNLIRDRR